jgi:hypothetical protein
VRGDDALRRAIGDYNSTWLGYGMIAKGTVSRVEQKGGWAMLHFQDSPDDKLYRVFYRSGVQRSTRQRR